MGSHAHTLAKTAGMVGQFPGSIPLISKNIYLSLQLQVAERHKDQWDTLLATMDFSNKKQKK